MDNGQDVNLLARSKDFHDGAIPAGNSVDALNLLKFSDFTLDESYKEKAILIFETVGLHVLQSPTNYAQLLMAVDYQLDGSKEVVISGPKNHSDFKKVVSGLHEVFSPNKVMGLSAQDSPKEMELVSQKPMLDDRLTIYVCEDGVCQLPVHEVETAVQHILK